ncbi:hypothetical protein NQ315_011285 [Exocentrus adspersus]|uniref:Transposase Tc1-like domain-containing protein n=1 Tax=Exocentrus adspersus TaxID=1586481 RepID=A0AAV8VJY6_9CUCU|nr:hypothetical protein NQ315_011285 [Exocentrus adspersus]
MAYKLDIRKSVYNLVGRLPKRGIVKIFRDQNVAVSTIYKTIAECEQGIPCVNLSKSGRPKALSNAQSNRLVEAAKNRLGKSTRKLAHRFHYSAVVIFPKSAQAPMRRYRRENPVKCSLLCAARISIHRDTDERVTHRSPPRAAVETESSKSLKRRLEFEVRKPPHQKYSKSGIRQSAGLATDPVAQTQAEGQVYPGHSRAKEPVADQPLPQADVPPTSPGTNSEPVRKRVHVGVNPVVLLGPWLYTKLENPLSAAADE